jgi:hypothetical protein
MIECQIGDLFFKLMTKMHDWWLKYIATTKCILNNGQTIDGLCTCSLEVPYGFGRFNFVILVQIKNSMIFVLLIFFSSHIFLFNMKCEMPFFPLQLLWNLNG